MNPPVATASQPLALREFHAFEAHGARFLYMVPSAGIFRMDGPSVAILDALQLGPQGAESLIEELSSDYPLEQIVETIEELTEIRAIGDVNAPKQQVPNDLPPEGFPLTTMVLNVTNKCNLACTYCYEYGEDKIVDTKYGDAPKFMSEQTAEESVEFLLAESRGQEVAHLTFFGGETLLNFPVLQQTVAYARRRAAEEGKRIEFSLTTNATLLRPEIIEWLADNQIGVTISIDGPKEVQDGLRVFHNGKGTYDVVQPKIKELLRVHRTRPIGARVTLTQKNMDVLEIFRHLTEDMGFWEVGLAPVTTQDQRDYAITPEGKDSMLSQFEVLAQEWLQCALRDEHHGFSNVKDTLEEIHKGVSKAYGCGAGLGLMGAAMSRCVTASRAHPSTRSARSPKASIVMCRTSSWRITTSPRRPTATHAGPARFAQADVTTRHTFSTVSPRTRTCTTAPGCGAGRTRAWRSTERWRRRTPSSWSVSMHRRVIGKGDDT